MTSTQSSDVPSHHLIGRALVPFFDAEENVNASMTVDPMTQLYEQVDIDARVWDKALGYFVYPNESKTTNTNVSKPITIQKTVSNIPKSPIWKENGGTSMLLTPDFLLSRSAPNTSTSSSSFSNRLLSTETSTIQVSSSSCSTETKKTTRSSSAQLSSTRSKSRSNTPNRNRGSNKSTTSSSSPSSSTIENGITNNGKKKRANKEKGKEELSTSGKWAWSAFQNSPDPKSLPLPPSSFTTNSPSLTSTTDHGKMTIPLELPPPCVPPDSIVKTREKVEQASIEHSMTQDLRRMLNIGGG